MWAGVGGGRKGVGWGRGFINQLMNHVDTKASNAADPPPSLPDSAPSLPIPAVAGNSALPSMPSPPASSACSAVAPPPSPGPALPPPSPIPPPKRAALPQGSIACPLPPPPELPSDSQALKERRCLRHKAKISETDDSDNELLVVGELASPKLAQQINRLTQELGERRAYAGVSAFLLFALHRRLRVFVWYGAEREDIVKKYAPWASDSMVMDAAFEAVATCLKDGLNLIADPRATNHWVACIKADGRSTNYDMATHNETTQTFIALYYSVDRIIIETICDGDCALDVMSLMCGMQRRATSRMTLREQLSRFLLSNAGNRALISSMFQLGEVSEHLGLYELESSGAALTRPADSSPAPWHHEEGRQGSCEPARHGDGMPKRHGNGMLEHCRSFTDDEFNAVKWKCRLDKASPETVTNILQNLPDWSIKQATAEYSQRLAAPIKREPAATFLLKRDPHLRDRRKAAKHFLEWCRDRFENPMQTHHAFLLQQGRMPYGWFAAYVKAHTPLLRACQRPGTNQYAACLRRYEYALKDRLQNKSAVADDSDSDDNGKARYDPERYNARFMSKASREGAQYYSHGYSFVRPYFRRRNIGGGRHKQAAIIRELLIDWYSKIRHSVNCKIMCRFPKKVLLVKAQMLQEDYLTECLSRDVQVEPVEINARWLNALLAEYRISSRIPNRKFKVPRYVLAERLEIFWISVAKVRKLISLKWGYDPDCRNIDQSPFHANEAGSKACNTLALKGAPTVPLIENHAATRERWSLNSVTFSSTEKIRRRLPGFELMFLAQGHVLEGRLQMYVFNKALPFKVTVVTGPKGSYREEHILNFLEAHLERWGPGRRWELIFLDAYAPGLTDNVQRCCWIRGYIEITHGGGASMVAQTNDTDHHLWVRKRFIEKQTDLMIKKARATGGGLTDLTREENIDIMIDVMRDVDLHLQAAKGYKYTGTTNNFDGSEDSLICREAKIFWEERGMRKKIDSAVAEVEAQFNAGLLQWSYQTVQSLIGAYPRRNHLDVLSPGQEDEAGSDPDGVPWDDASSGEEDGDQAIQDEAIPDVDPADWKEPPNDLLDISQGEATSHGNGGGGDDATAAAHKPQDHGDGDCDDDNSLSVEEAAALQEHSARFQSLQEAKRIFEGIGGALGAQLCLTVGKVMHNERKRFRDQIAGDSAVDKAMRSRADAEEAAARRHRAEFQQASENKRQLERVNRELKTARSQLTKTRKENREASAVTDAWESLKTYSLDDMGKDKKNAGGASARKVRLEAFNRVRATATLSSEQLNDWKHFSEQYDRRMAEEHGGDWARLFGEILQNLLNELDAGKANALSVFMHEETTRCLHDVEGIRLSGCN